MGVILTVDGKRPQAATYSLQTDVVASDPSNTSAGVGGLAVTTPLHSSGLKDSWEFLNGKKVSLTFQDDNPESFLASIQNVTLSNLRELSFSGESPLRPLQGVHRVPPFTGTRAEAIQWILSSVPNFQSTVTVNSSVTGNATVPAYHGEVWPFFRDFLSANKLEAVVWNDQGILIRPWGSAVGSSHSGGSIPQPTSFTEDISGDQACELVEVNWYENDYLVNGTAYPVAGEDPNIISVNAGEVAVIELKTNMGLSSVNNPVPVDFLGAGYTGEGTLGSYTIAGNDGNKVSAAAWVAAGGSVTTAIHHEDPYTIVLTVRSPTSGVLATPDNRNTAAPYSIAMTDGTLYSRLFITGTGVRTGENTLTLNTGASGELAQSGVGATLDNRHVGSLSQAYDVGIRMAQAYSGVRKSISQSYVDSSNRFNVWSRAGSVLSGGRSNYRVTSVSTTPEGTSETLEPFNTFADFNSRWTGKTFSDFNSEWSGLRMQDFSVSPLRKL